MIRRLGRRWWEESICYAMMVESASEVAATVAPDPPSCWAFPTRGMTRSCATLWPRKWRMCT